MNPRMLVMAKAPLPGTVKTRLGASIGMERAADLAAAALLDTIDAAAGASADPVWVALAGSLAGAARESELREALEGCVVLAQRGAGFGDRLVAAHRDAAGAGGADRVVVQVGMDTPQVRAEDLAEVAAASGTGTAVLGPAEDGGWWALGLTGAAGAEVLGSVPMSTSETGRVTREALLAAGLRVTEVGSMRDADTASDAALIAAGAPWTRFARAWAGRSSR